MEGSLFDRLVHDCQNCVAGIAQQDPHLLFDGAANLRTHLSMISSLISGCSIEEISEILGAVLQNLQQLRAVVEEHLAACDAEEEINDQVYLDLDVETVIELRKQGMPWSKIATVFGISRNSLYKFRRKHGIEEPNMTLSDDDLRTFILQVAAEHPNAGCDLMQGALLTAGFRASKNRVWMCLREVDPIGVARRRRRAIRRRVYRCKGSNYLWHMDSTHKLIMYRLVIHGCVDGFSRKLIYLNVADNNTGGAVLQMFKRGVRNSGLPRRVRGDRGVENNQVQQYMIQQGHSENAYIFGRSVHNTRIERMWGDVNTQVSSVFKDIFLSLETSNDLRIESELDLFCLVYVFLPRIQKALNNFLLQWNNHRMRTMRSRTPQQVWNISMRSQRVSGSSAHHADYVETDESEDDVIEAEDIQDEEERQLLLLECEKIVPNPLIDDYSQGKVHFKLLKNHLLSCIRMTMQPTVSQVGA